MAEQVKNVFGLELFVMGEIAISYVTLQKLKTFIVTQIVAG